MKHKGVLFTHLKKHPNVSKITPVLQGLKEREKKRKEKKICTFTESNCNEVIKLIKTLSM